MTKSKHIKYLNQVHTAHRPARASLAAQTAFFFLHWVGKKGLAKQSVAIGDHYAKKISACEPLAFNTSLCSAPGESLEKYA